MHNRKNLIFIIALLVSLMALPAMAGSLKDRMIQRKPTIDALLAKGAVGENNAGYLAYRGGNKNISDVAAENKDRGTVYKAIAKKTGTTPDVVGQRRAAKIAQQAKSGTWLQKPSGEWYKK